MSVYGETVDQTITINFVVVTAPSLVEGSLPTREVRGSNPVVENLYVLSAKDRIFCHKPSQGHFEQAV